MPEILVMAAAGNQGKILLPKLRDAGFTIRAFRETPGRDHELRDLGASQIFAGDATDRKLLRKALDGVDTVYHIGPTTHPLEFEMGLAMTGVAEEVGVGHFIYSSVLHAIASKLPQHRLKRLVEERILESTLEFTFLHPADYMMPFQFRSVFETGVLRALYGADQGQSMVDMHDFAEVVVKVALEREQHFGATYDLCAPGVPSNNDFGQTIAEVMGKPVEVVVEPADEWFDAYFGHGSGPGYRYQSGVIRACSLWYDQYEFRGNPNILRWLLGREPTTLKQCAEREWVAYQREIGAAPGA